MSNTPDIDKAYEMLKESTATRMLLSNLESQIETLTALIDKLLEAIEQMDAQRNQDYGMPENEAIKFRMRKVFSFIDYEINDSPEVKQYKENR